MGITEDQLLDMAVYRESDAFSPLEKLAIDLAAAMTRTPADVDEPLFAELRKRLNEAQVVELVGKIAQENFRARFNRPFDVQAEGLSEGAFCPLPER